MEVAQLLSCLDCSGPQQHQLGGEPAVVDTEDMVLLEFLSSL